VKVIRKKGRRDSPPPLRREPSRSCPESPAEVDHKAPTLFAVHQACFRQAGKRDARRTHSYPEQPGELADIV